MSDKKRVKYEITKSFDDRWRLETHSYLYVDSPEEGLQMIKALYSLEDKDNVDVSVTLNGNGAVDTILS